MNILNNARVTACDIMMRSLDPVKFTLKDNPFTGDIIETTRVPGVQVQMPEADWNHLLLVYHAHYQAHTSHPMVKSAWEQYQIAIALTKPL